MVVTKFTVVITLEYIDVLSHYVVYLKLIMLCVNYISIKNKLKEGTQRQEQENFQLLTQKIGDGAGQ